MANLSDYSLNILILPILNPKKYLHAHGFKENLAPVFNNEIKNPGEKFIGIFFNQSNKSGLLEIEKLSFEEFIFINSISFS